MKLAWQHHGPSRPSALSVPPLPSLIDWYALDYDPDARRVLYLVRPDDDERGAELHAFDGNAWTQITQVRVVTGGDHVECGGYDTVRKGMVAWGFDYDYDSKRQELRGTLVTAAGATPLEMRDLPVIEPDGDDDKIGTFDKHAVLAFDRGREVWVCLARTGIWELGPGDAWSQRSSGSIIPQEWHNKVGEGTYDPVGKRTAFIVQNQGDGYDVVVLAWDGAQLVRLAMDGLPELHIGLFDPVSIISGHAEHGLVLLAGGELFAVTASEWRSLETADQPPPKMENACMTYDPERRLLVVGPGKHEGAGGSNRHHAFFVLRGNSWEKQGVARHHSPIKDASYGNVRVAHVNGDWCATGTHSLRTWKWSGEWREIVDKKLGEELGGWEILQLCGGEHLHAVMKSGAVFVLDGEQWNRLEAKHAAFKDRTDFAIAVLPDGRLVVWGGENPRKLNDTLFFERKTWRVAKKSSPKPADFTHGRKDRVYVGTTAVFDTALAAVVRFGYEECAVLGADEVWSLYTPKGYQANISERSYGHVPAHDPETGETLLVDFVGDERQGDGIARVTRFDLDRCEPLATIEYPPELARKRQHDRAPYHTLAESVSYDPMTKSLYAQVLEDSLGVYRLDLTAAFVEAKGLGPRTLPKPKPTAKLAKAKSAARKK